LGALDPAIVERLSAAQRHIAALLKLSNAGGGEALTQRVDRVWTMHLCGQGVIEAKMAPARKRRMERVSS
jgi:hypothetical protein